VNHFGGSLGGPIERNKCSSSFDSEWVRIALPIVSAQPFPRLHFKATCCNDFHLAGTIP